MSMSSSAAISSDVPSPASPSSTTTVVASPKPSNFRDPGRNDLLNPPRSIFVADTETRLNCPSVEIGLLHPYTSLRNGAVDLEGLGRALYAIRRRSWNGFGWKPPAGQASAQVFMASQLLVLLNSGVCDKSFDNKNEISFEGQCGCLAPGSSSFSFYTENTAIDRAVARVYDEPNASRLMIGCQLTTLVNINPETRRPSPLHQDAIAEMKQSDARIGTSARVRSLGMTPLGKLVSHPDIIATTAAGSKCFTYCQTLRCLQDYDFNMHLNQGSWSAAAINAITSMTAHDQLDGPDGKTISSHPVYKQHVWLNSIARAIRIDYGHELQEREGELVVNVYRSEKITELGAASVGAELLTKMAPPTTSDGSSRTVQRVAYFAIGLKGDASAKVFARGFVVYDYTPVC